MLGEVSADVMNCDCIIRLDNKITLVAGKKEVRKLPEILKFTFILSVSVSKSFKFSWKEWDFKNNYTALSVVYKVGP